MILQNPQIDFVICSVTGLFDVNNKKVEDFEALPSGKDQKDLSEHILEVKYLHS